VFLAGTLAYSTRRPTLWPRVFGYHELFHLAVVVGSVAYFLVVVRFVAPLAPP
jgi:hemolysin III